MTLLKMFSTTPGLNYEVFFLSICLYDTDISLGLYDADISLGLYDESFLSICLYDAEVSFGLYDGSFGVFQQKWRHVLTKRSFWAFIQN